MIRNRLTELYGVTRAKLVGIDAYPLHDHDFGEIAWVDDGEGLSHRVNGVEVPLPQGTLFFLRPSDGHSFHVAGDKPVFLFNVAFQWHVFEGLKQRYFPGCQALYGENLPLPKTVSLTDLQLQSYREGAIGLFRAPRTAFYIERFLMNLFADFYPSSENPFLAEAPQWMRNAWNLIQSPDHFRLGVPEFYRLCGRSPEHVSREFQKYAGKTVVHAVTELRMRHAAALLAGTMEDIIEISRDCGFESLSHFYVCFRKAYGCTPRDYRKRAQKEMYPGVA